MDWMDRFAGGFYKAFIERPLTAVVREELEKKARMQKLSDRELKFIAGEAGHLDMWAARYERQRRLQKKWESLK